MKNNNSKALVLACLFAGSLLVSIDGNSQDRKLPDGSIVYSDGTRRLPNGTLIYIGGNNGNYNNYPSNNGGVVALPDGTVVYPDGSRRFPNGNIQQGNKRYDDRRYYPQNNGRWLPPGQAKKMYGGNARDYARGQEKKWKDERNDHDDRRYDEERGHRDRD